MKTLHTYYGTLLFTSASFLNILQKNAIRWNEAYRVSVENSDGNLLCNLVY